MLSARDVDNHSKIIGFSVELSKNGGTRSVQRMRVVDHSSVTIVKRVKPVRTLTLPHAYF